MDRHRGQKEAEEIVKEARDSGLPYDARAKPWDRELSQWQVKLLRTIKERLSQQEDYPLDVIRTTVKEAASEITREFQARQAAERDRELRERVKASARFSIPFGLTDEGRRLAVPAIEEGIDRLPPGTSKDKLEAAADVALQPFRDAIRKRAEEQRRQQEQAHLQEVEARRKRDAEEAAARQRREANEEQARKWSAAERRADSIADLSALYHLVVELDRKGDLDHGSFDENWALAQRLVKRIRPALVDLLMASPNLSDDKIKLQVELLVDRNLDSCLVGG